MKQLQVAAHKLNLRQHPTTKDSLIVGVLDKNEILELLDFEDEFRWAKVKRISSGTIGYCSYKYCIGVPHPNYVRSNDLKWLKIGLGELNTSELKDPLENHRILTYLRTCEYLSDDLQNTDETAWCSAFANWCVEQAGYTGTNSAWALDWRYWGQPSANRRGAIAVFKRYVQVDGITETRGHVGFYLGQIDGQVSLLGGNQGNRVSIITYPVDNDKYKFLGCRKA